jgi:hypothetical protein
VNRFVSFGKQEKIKKEYMPSSVVSAIRYDTARATLRIFFISGTVYDYKNVPEEVFNAMRTSSSRGIYFNRHIKDCYQFEKIK